MIEEHDVQRRDAERLSAVYETMRAYANRLAGDELDWYEVSELSIELRHTANRLSLMMCRCQVDTVAHDRGESRICFDDGSVVIVPNR